MNSFNRYFSLFLFDWGFTPISRLFLFCHISNVGASTQLFWTTNQKLPISTNLYRLTDGSSLRPQDCKSDSLPIDLDLIRETDLHLEQNERTKCGRYAMTVQRLNKRNIISCMPNLSVLII